MYKLYTVRWGQPSSNKSRKGGSRCIRGRFFRDRKTRGPKVGAQNFTKNSGENNPSETHV